MPEEPRRAASPPPDASRALRQSLGQFATGVAVVTAWAEDHPVGVTVNSFSSVSLEPPLILWSIADRSQSYPAFMDARHFAVHVLASDQMNLASRFARSGSEKFAGIDFARGPDGTPLLEGCAAVFECAHETHYRAGDHTVIIGRVLRHQHRDRPLLLFAKGRYGLGTELPDQPVTSVTATAAGMQGPDMMLGLMRTALIHYSDAFQRDREAEGLTISQGRALLALERYGSLPIEALARRCLLSEEEAERTLINLVQRGLAAQSDDGSAALLPAGHAKLEGLKRRAFAHEARLFAGVPSEDVETMRRLLKMIIAFHER